MPREPARDNLVEGEHLMYPWQKRANRRTKMQTKRRNLRGLVRALAESAAVDPNGVGHAAASRGGLSVHVWSWSIQTPDTVAGAL